MSYIFMKTLDQITLEIAHPNHIQIDRYWLLPNGQVGVVVCQRKCDE